MRLLRAFALVSVVSVAFFLGTKTKSAPNPANSSPSITKFNSNEVKGKATAAGVVPVSQGNSKALWAKVKGKDVDSLSSSGGFVLTANGSGGADFQPVPSAPTTLPPSGAAGGDLTGNYPNPTIGAGAISAAKIAAGVIPTTLPPSGAAGGGLSGTYPNPSLVLPQGLAVTDSPTFAGLTVNGPVNFPAGSIPASSLAASPVFGNGSDGNTLVPSTTTLTRDMYFNNLTVETGVTLNTGGFRIFVRGTCALNGTGSIRNNGSNATVGSNTAGPGAPSGTLGGGANGGNGGGFNMVGSIGSSISTSLGGNGGTGAQQGANAGGVGGVSTAPAIAEGGVQIVNALPYALTCGLLNSNSRVNGGAGGGGGGGAGFLGGGGGGGGGVVMIAARTFSGTGTIQANGGTASGGALGAGGGGGGGGCVVIVTTSVLPVGITASAAGGAGGPGGSPTPGAPGRVVVVF